MTCTGTAPSRQEKVRAVVTEVVPWLSRRARDLALVALHKARHHFDPTTAPTDALMATRGDSEGLYGRRKR